MAEYFVGAVVGTLLAWLFVFAMTVGRDNREREWCRDRQGVFYPGGVVLPHDGGEIAVQAPTCIIRVTSTTEVPGA